MAQLYQARVLSGGRQVDYTPGTAKSAGSVVVANGLVGIVANDIAANTLGALHVGAVAAVVKATGAVQLGEAVYWNATGNPVGGTAGSGAATTTAAGNMFLGYAVLAAGSSDEVVQVLMVQINSITVHSPLSNLITDPGNTAAIPVTNSGHVQIVTAGAETRTLAAPTFVGQQLLICMKTDGGDCVIAVATTVNSTGNNRITLNDAGDNILLHAIQNGSNIRWRVTVNDGCALSTV